MEVLETRRIRYRDRLAAQGREVQYWNGKHRLKYKPENSGRELLPAGPLQAFIRQRTNVMTIVELADLCELDDKAIHRILKSKFVTFDLADKILVCVDGPFIQDLYPQEYERLLEAA